jgi:aspartate--ammonia ligase
MSTVVLDKKADLAGPGIGDYNELEQVLPRDYRSLLTPRETQQAIFRVKRYIEDNLCKELNLMMVEVPLIVDVESGVNDMLDRDGSRTPIQFYISNDRDKHPMDAQVVQAATKWKRVALKQFGCKHGEGICTDMRAVRTRISFSCTRKRSSNSTPTCLASSARRRFCKNIQQSSSSESAGL